MEDPDTVRVTGVKNKISKTDWATLALLMVTSRYTDDPQQPARPLSRLDDVIGTYIDRLVVFAEPRTLDAAEPLMQTLATLNQPERALAVGCRGLMTSNIRTVPATPL